MGQGGITLPVVDHPRHVHLRGYQDPAVDTTVVQALSRISPANRGMPGRWEGSRCYPMRRARAREYTASCEAPKPPSRYENDALRRDRSSAGDHASTFSETDVPQGPDHVAPQEFALEPGRSCLEAALRILEIPRKFNDESSPDGQLYIMRWRVSSFAH